MGIISNSSSMSTSSSTSNFSECKTPDMKNENNLSVKMGHKWTDNETKYLLDQYRIYFPQIGPFRAFKDRTAMFNQLAKDLHTKFNIKVNGQQCINRYKNVVKQNKNALLDNKISGNTPTQVPYDNEIEDIKSIDDSLKPEVLVGVNYMKINEKTEVDMGTIKNDKYETSENDSDSHNNEKIRKRFKSNSLEKVLREISTTAEVNRERRHREKCDLLVSLLGAKPTKNSE